MTMTRDARNDAKEMAQYFLDEIVGQIIDTGEASNDYNNDYAGGDEYHHEAHVDRYYTLLEAAEILDEYSEFEETDSGLWEGMDPREAVKAQAAYTYGHAVGAKWDALIEQINTAAGDIDDQDGMPLLRSETVRATVESVIAEF